MTINREDCDRLTNDRYTYTAYKLVPRTKKPNLLQRIRHKIAVRLLTGVWL